MTDEQLIKRIAEVLFHAPEIDAWDIYDTLESIFHTERPKLKEKYLNFAKNEEIRQKEQEVLELVIKLANAQKELETIKVNV